jgi:hypothetical protein
MTENRWPTREERKEAEIVSKIQKNTSPGSQVLQIVEALREASMRPSFISPAS